MLPTILCKEVNKVIKCYLQNQNCTTVVANLPPKLQFFTFLATSIDDHKHIYYIPMSALFRQNLATNQCEFKISVGYNSMLTQDVVVLGHPLFEAYYVIINYDTERLFLSGYRNFEGFANNGLPLWLALLIASLLVAFALGGVYFLINKRRKKHLSEKLKSMGGDNDD
jgi:hypothetical protein